MKYNFKRAVGISFLLYLATFIVGIVCGIASGQDMATMNGIPDSFWYYGMAAAVVLTLLFTMWYFRDKSIAPSAYSGFYFGATAVVLSSALDFLLFSLGNNGGVKVDLGDYYGDYRFWIILLLVVATAKMVGWFKGPRVPVSV